MKLVALTLEASTLLELGQAQYCCFRSALTCFVSRRIRKEPLSFGSGCKVLVHYTWPSTGDTFDKLDKFAEIFSPLRPEQVMSGVREWGPDTSDIYTDILAAARPALAFRSGGRPEPREPPDTSRGVRQVVQAVYNMGTGTGMLAGPGGAELVDLGVVRPVAELTHSTSGVVAAACWLAERRQLGRPQLELEPLPRP